MNRFKIYDLGFKNGIILFILTAYFLLPTTILAQAPNPPDTNTRPELTEYELLEPLPGVTKRGSDTKTDANSYIAGMFRLMISIAGVFAVLRIIYAGILMMSSDSISKKTEGHGIIQETLWGLALALSAWIIVAVVVPSGGPNCQSGSFCFNLSLSAIDIKSNSNTPPGGSGGVGSPGPLTEEEVAQQLRNGGIRVAPGIRLAGLRQKTIDELISLRNNCNCVVYLTSATGGNRGEQGEFSHRNGYKVDLRNSGVGSNMTRYIMQNYTRELPNRSDGAQLYRAPSGALYALEYNHWDVLVR